jgi:hypothetical protein
MELDATPRHYILDVDGAYMNTEIKLNDYILIKHPHGYTPMLVDLTDHIRAGRRTIWRSPPALCTPPPVGIRGRASTATCSSGRAEISASSPGISISPPPLSTP